MKQQEYKYGNTELSPATRFNFSKDDLLTGFLHTYTQLHTPHYSGEMQQHCRSENKSTQRHTHTPHHCTSTTVARDSVAPKEPTKTCC